MFWADQHLWTNNSKSKWEQSVLSVLTFIVSDIKNETVMTNGTCKCTGKCTDCKCSDTCQCKSMKKCPFIAAHPNWMKCPFMSSMFGCQAKDQAVQSKTHEQCDSGHCTQVPDATCTSCHQTGLSHTVTLETSTEEAADKTEDLMS